ncbi:hypothetical protein [Nocardioides soli]|uniref:hypothetical protein n=1 Tax=Nocardioides soli TaxID=1036020 RepID=UPI001C85773D|nr:hypothetical protein [Nocardioides soli]
MTTTYLYEDPEHPDRATGSFESVAYTPEDQALLLGLAAYEHQQQHGGMGSCSCGWPIEVAWHSEMDGWFGTLDVVCHVCTARAGKTVTHTIVRDTRPAGHPALPPFVLGVTTTEA